MPLLTSLPGLFPFSFRFFLPGLYPAPSKSEKPSSTLSSFAPVSKISSFAAHALTNHVSQHHLAQAAATGLLKEKAETPPPTPTLTVPVRAHLRHTRSADTVFHGTAPAQPASANAGPGRQPLRAITNTNSMPYALPSPSPTVVLSVPQPTNDIHLGQSFVFPLRNSPPRPLHPSAMASENASKKERPSAIVLTENKENSGPSRATGPMPLIPRTGSTTNAPSQPEASTSAAAAGDSSGSSTATPASRRSTPPARHTRKPPMGINVSRELTASPQQPSPPH